MNETIKKFLTRHNINPKEISKYVSPIIYHPRELNPIVNEYGIYKEPEDHRICIDDILGHSNLKTRETNLFDNLNEFFDEKGDGYHSRSVSMLQYSNEEIVDKLSNTFVKEPIRICEIEKNKYVISNNGCHRFTVLKTHLIFEFSKSDCKKEAIERIRQKYTIPVKLSPLDRIKTYCNYLINLTETEKIWITSEYTEDYKKTGNIKLELATGEIAILNDDELIKYTQEKLKLSNDFEEIMTTIKLNCDRIPEFRKFIQTYFNEYVKGKKRC